MIKRDIGRGWSYAGQLARMTTPNTLKYTEMVMFEKHKSNKQGSPQIKESISMQEKISSSVAQPPAPSTKPAVIGPGIEISGDVTASANLDINGKIMGNIVQSSHDVDIGESGKVRANISAKMVKVAGEVEGDIVGSEKVLISKTGRVRGNIVAPRVQLEDGALFRGSIDMDPGRAAKPKTAAVAKKAAGISQAGSTTGSSARASGNGATPASAKEAGRKEPGLNL
jgi:cytoskeletal protein CcmA (bactofilin family)